MCSIEYIWQLVHISSFYVPFSQENQQAVVDELARNLPIITKSVTGGSVIFLCIQCLMISSCGTSEEILGGASAAKVLKVSYPKAFYWTVSIVLARKLKKRSQRL